MPKAETLLCQQWSIWSKLWVKDGAKNPKLIVAHLNSGPRDFLLSKDLMISSDTSWVPQEVIWGVLAIQNVCCPGA